PVVVPQDLLVEHPLHQGVNLCHRQPCKRRYMADPVEPVLTPDTLLLERQGHKLLRQDVPRLWWRCNRLDVSCSPQINQSSHLHECIVPCSQEQAVATHTRTAACSAHALQKARDCGRSVDLDNAVEGTNVDTKFQDTRCHDHAVISR